MKQGYLIDMERGHAVGGPRTLRVPARPRARLDRGPPRRLHSHRRRHLNAGAGDSTALRALVTLRSRPYDGLSSSVSRVLFGWRGRRRMLHRPAWLTWVPIAAAAASPCASQTF